MYSWNSSWYKQQFLVSGTPRFCLSEVNSQNCRRAPRGSYGKPPDLFGYLVEKLTPFCNLFISIFPSCSVTMVFTAQRAIWHSKSAYLEINLVPINDWTGEWIWSSLFRHWCLRWKLLGPPGYEHYLPKLVCMRWRSKWDASCPGKFFSIFLFSLRNGVVLLPYISKSWPLVSFFLFKTFKNWLVKVF